MAGLETSLSTPPGPRQVLKRYLTPLYGFTLGVAVLLGVLAGIWHGNATPGIVTNTPVAIAQTSAPTGESTKAPDQARPTLTAWPDVPPTPNEQTPSPLGVNAAELKGITVTLWYPWAGPSGAVLQDIVDEFNRTNRWGITVEARGIDGFGMLDEAVETALAGDNLPDVLIDYGYQARHWDVGDVFADLRAYAEDPVWGLSADEQGDFLPGFWSEDAVYDDSGSLIKRLGIPFSRSAYLMFYNQSWADELGFSEPPTTPEEFRQQACAAADAYASLGDKSTPSKGGWLITTQPGALMGWLDAFGSSITNRSGSVYEFKTTSSMQALEYLRGLQMGGCAWEGSGPEAATEFASRQALFMMGSLLDINAQRQAFQQAGNPDEWSVIPFPSDKKTVVSTYGPSLFISRSTPSRQLAAWLVVEWLSYPPNQAAWAESLGGYPARSSSLRYLTGPASSNPQWAQALQLLPEAQSEPNLASWGAMRWALSDAMAQLFDPQFTPEQIPSMLDNLDTVATEIMEQVP